MLICSMIGTFLRHWKKNFEEVLSKSFFTRHHCNQRFGSGTTLWQHPQFFWINCGRSQSLLAAAFLCPVFLSVNSLFVFFFLRNGEELTKALRCGKPGAKQILAIANLAIVFEHLRGSLHGHTLIIFPLWERGLSKNCYGSTVVQE